ncbi:uncharacterized protein PS065_016757 isoform 1-T3 [Dugong dugon]
MEYVWSTRDSSIFTAAPAQPRLLQPAGRLPTLPRSPSARGEPAAANHRARDRRRRRRLTAAGRPPPPETRTCSLRPGLRPQPHGLPAARGPASAGDGRCDPGFTAPSAGPARRRHHRARELLAGRGLGRRSPACVRGAQESLHFMTLACHHIAPVGAGLPGNKTSPDWLSAGAR